MDFLTLVDILSKGSAAVLAVFLVGFLFELVVPGRTYKTLKEDCKRKDQKIDELNAALLKAVRVTGQAVHVTGRAVEKGQGGGEAGAAGSEEGGP